MKQIIVVAGATGNLGNRIIKALVHKGAIVHALVRPSTNKDKLKELEAQGVKVFKVELHDLHAVSSVCVGASCVISALSGLSDEIIGLQSKLLDAAVQAKVPRFIPSDFSLDFTNLKPGKNRNLDLRRTFHKYAEKTPIALTTIFNGPFMDLLTGEMPMILSKQQWVLYWGNADQRMDFTTMDNTAEFTANAALDPSAPRYLKIYGDQVSARQIKSIVSEVTGKNYRLFRAGGIGLLNTIITITKAVSPGTKSLYPAWQGMQYMRDMVEGRARIDVYDNDRYPEIRWTTVKDLLSANM